MEDLVNLSNNQLGSFYAGKKIFITGHTGFKGSWLCKILSMLNADITGFSLAPPTNPSLFDIAHIGDNIHSVIGDVRDKEQLTSVFKDAKPDIVFHLAAQPLVRLSYDNPAYTYETNVMGTVNILECIRQTDCVKSFVNITTDKVYRNKEWNWGYRENEELNGFDPYSNSKSCSELVTNCYKQCFFMDKKGQTTVPVSTARAGNVIGGGDFAQDRIIPDCIRAALEHKTIFVRNPFSVRPYQHVLEPLFAYLLIAVKQYSNPLLSGSYNVGPNDDCCIQTGRLVDCFIDNWGEGMQKRQILVDGPHEASFLKLDCSKIKTMLGWSPSWSIDEAVKKVVEWTKCWVCGNDTNKCMEQQIKEFLIQIEKSKK